MEVQLVQWIHQNLTDFEYPKKSPQNDYYESCKVESTRFPLNGDRLYLLYSDMGATTKLCYVQSTILFLPSLFQPVYILETRLCNYFSSYNMILSAHEL